MNKRASMKRLMTLALSVIMVAGIMPVTALAETGAFPVGASADMGDEVIALEPLNTESDGLRALADTTDLITGDGYTFDPATGKLTVSSDDGTTAWRNDTEIAAEDADRYAAIKSLELSDDVNAIGDFAFSYCLQLQGKLTIPASVKSIGAYAFECCRITELDLSNFTGAIEAGAFYCCSDITGTVTIAAGVSAIGNYAFYACAGITALDISGYTGIIGIEAFKGCSSLTGTLTISAGRIQKNAFENCSNITALDISARTTYIGSEAFKNCSILNSVTFRRDTPPTMGVLAPAPYGTDGVGTTFSGVAAEGTIYCPTSAYREYATLPDFNSLTGWTFVGVDALDLISGDGYTFDPATGKLTVTSNDGTTAWRSDSGIAEDDTERYEAIKSLEIGDGVTDIGESAFEDCAGITALDLSGFTGTIGAYAFSGCSGITGTITIPVGVTDIGASAFENCASITTLDLSGYMGTIGSRTFKGCASLTEITIPTGVTGIGYGAFDGCTSLARVKMPTSVTSIDDYAFNACSALTAVIIPANVESIGINAFARCDALDSVKFNSGTPPEISDSAFYSDAETPLVGTVYCPTGTSEAYQTALASTRLKDWTYSDPIPITFTDDAAFDVPTGTISSDIDGIFVADGVSGGTPPYTFSLVSGPDWLAVYDNGFISGKRPDAKAEATTAVIRVTDSEEPAAYATITINIGAVTKLPQSAPPTPYWESTTMTSVKLGEIPNAWYRCGADGEWQSSRVFTGLTPDTSYTFYACYPETSTHEASPPSEGLTVTTMKVWLTGTVTIVGDAHFGATLAADTSGLRTNLEGTDMGDLTYEWHRKNGETITAVGTDSATYTLTQADIGATITLTVTAANCNGSVVSAATTTITKAPYTGTTTVTDTVRAEQTTTGKTLTLPPLPDGATYAATGTAGGTTPTLINGTPSVSGTTLTYSTISQPDNTTATITIAVTGVTNYNDYNVVVTVTATALIPQTITFPNANEGITRTYGDAAFTHVASGGTGSGAITYTSSNTAVATVNATSGLVTIKGAGTATITAIKAADGAYAEAKASYALTVNKATVTITANDKSATVGDTQPAYTYTVTGLAAGNILATLPTVNCPTADMNTAGTYTIVASGAAVPSAVNYNEVIVYINGTLTVNAKPPVTYTLTIRAGAGGSITQGTSGNCAQGTIINISANANSGYTFNGWTSSYGGAFGNAGSASTTFTMPGNATAITANFISTEVEPPDTTPTPTPTILNPYPVISHPNAWSVDSSGNATAKIDAPFEKFVRLLNNGVVINPSNYTVTDGSTIITFKAIYLETLSAGTHNIRAEFTDGYADLTLSIEETADIPDGDTPDVPKTGDNSNMLGWIIALLASGLGLLCLVVWRKWRQVKGKR